MTLCTHVQVLDEIEPTEVAAKCNELIGATPATVTYDERSKFGDYWRMGNEAGQGLCALFALEYRPGLPLRSTLEDPCPKCDCPADERCSPEPLCWLELSFDTTYSYNVGGEGCGHLHARLVAQLGAWLDARGVRWLWENEFTGERHEGYERLPDLISGGTDATEWFNEKVRPVIEAAGGNPCNVTARPQTTLCSLSEEMS